MVTRNSGLYVVGNIGRLLELIDKCLERYSHYLGDSSQMGVNNFLNVILTAASQNDKGHSEMEVGEEEKSGFYDPSRAYCADNFTPRSSVMPEVFEYLDLGGPVHAHVVNDREVVMVGEFRSGVGFGPVSSAARYEWGTNRG